METGDLFISSNRTKNNIFSSISCPLGVVHRAFKADENVTVKLLILQHIFMLSFSSYTNTTKPNEWINQFLFFNKVNVV